MNDTEQMRGDVRSGRSTAVCFLARGAAKGWQASLSRFVISYRRFAAGAEHTLCVLFKGFTSAADYDEAREMFVDVAHEPIDLADDSFDIGAYLEVSRMLEQDQVLMLNTHSELLAPDWLRKLDANLALPGVGLVGATGSYELSPLALCRVGQKPNIHIRSNAFMLDRCLLLELAGSDVIRSKEDAWQFESGPDGLTRRVQARGLETLVVGRNGRGYSPRFWPRSETYRQGTQENLLIADNQTRAYITWPQPQKQAMSFSAWGNELAGTY
jgi:hypothetical protein